MKRRDLPRRMTATSGRKQCEQLSTESGACDAAQAFVPNNECASGNDVAPASASLQAMQTIISPLTHRRQSVSRSGAHRRANKKRSKHRGGWPTTSGMPWGDVKEIAAVCHGAKTAGMPLNWFVSIRPPSHVTNDAERKKLCYRRASHLGCKFRRHGAPFVALRVFEKDVGGLLHVHLLVHVPRHLQNEFSGWGDGIVTDIRSASPKHVGYISKQRQPLPPDFEKVVSHRRKKGAPFRGRRWSLTPDAKALLSGCSV